jgi:hypothetical protein
MDGGASDDDSIQQDRHAMSRPVVWRTCAALAILFGVNSAPASEVRPGSMQPEGLRFLDTTQRNDGWAVAQVLAIDGSSKRKMVIVSYLDGAMTRAFYDIAVTFARPPHNLPIFGVVRAPQHATEPNADGFDIFINGLPLGELSRKDREAVKAIEAVSKPALLREILGYIKSDYYP